MRILIEYILPIFLPTAGWMLWLIWAQQRARRLGQQGPAWQSVPISWLLAAGVVLTMTVAIGGTLRSGYTTGSYQPARIDDQGHLVPGGIR
ncbi:hypothetical protein [Telmatospirillum sp.]|uniref:hypothetical protein n=1 Tax=Telmatospirillum sp. TaxID=2079197 RepID=UPI002851C44F|nr:hypothetical protein [Telmatospirillum sp.]MDR3437219.1 hypothetical protein [Telmatospirillum sp.]